MKYIVRTEFEACIEWEGDADNEEQACQLADAVISSMKAEEFLNVLYSVDQSVELQVESAAV